MLSNAITVNILAAALMAGATLVASAPDASANPTPSVHWMKLHDGIIAFDDSGGNGPIIICVPGLGDLRQQYRFLAPRLESAGFRVITMDLRGHGASSVNWPDYSAAAVWAAAEIPGAVAGIVLIDPFVREMPTSVFLNAFLKVATQRPWGPSFWSMYYGALYK